MQFQVGQQLGLMDGFQGAHCFQLNDEFILHEEIETVAAGKSTSL